MPVKDPKTGLIIPTPKQRSILYKETIERLTHKDSKYICITLKYLYLCKFYTDWGQNWLPLSKNMEIFFPEFMKQKPRNKKEDSAWWKTDKGGNLKRIKALKKAIELTKQTI